MNEHKLDTENINQNKLWIRNFSLSILLHLLFVVAFIHFFGWQSDSSKVNAGFFTLDTKEFVQEESDKSETNKEIDAKDEQPIQEETKIDKSEETKTTSYSDIVADTTNLDQVYSETTLNLSIKYPKGWTYIDQKKKKKLDGVTFWASDGLYNPPPYIHFEVVDKDMFIEKRYSFKIDLEKCKAYYNDPEEMQGYVTLIVYIRTDLDVDFKLKLMMKGKIEFRSFQPRFWAILKSLNFGKSFF